MKALIQRVTKAKVSIRDKEISSISHGMLILLGITEEDGQKEVEKLSDKILKLRIFSDQDNKMNLSIKEAGGEILLVSQFTLIADSRKGNRPSFIKAARPEKAMPLYNEMIGVLGTDIPLKTGEFGEYMHIDLVNDGPVTIMLDTKEWL